MSTVLEARACTVLFRLASAVPESRGVFLLPANICPVVPLAFLAAGRRFEFIDLEPESLCLDPVALRCRLRSAQRPPVAGLVYARSYGASLDASELFRELKSLHPGLLVIDDRCLSLPELNPDDVDWQGADAVLFSTGYSKPVDLGFGGFAHLVDGATYSKRGREYDPADLSRITRLYKACIRRRRPIYGDDSGAEKRRALERFAWLDTRAAGPSWAEYSDRVQARAAECEAHRARINATYSERIRSSARLAAGYHGWRFQIRVADPDLLQRRLFEAGLFASRHYFPAALLFGGEPCPVASALHDEIVNLFNDHRVSESEAERVCRIVARHLDRDERASGS